MSKQLFEQKNELEVQIMDLIKSFAIQNRVSVNIECGVNIKLDYLGGVVLQGISIYGQRIKTEIINEKTTYEKKYRKT